VPDEPLLAVDHLSKTYVAGTAALKDVSFSLDTGCALAIVGPSGSGKTTLARCLAHLETPTSGEFRFRGAPIAIQLIFQQPAASLNPRFTAAQIVEEPLVIQRRAPAERRERALRAIQQVGLSAAGLDRPSRRFSGGEQQRLAIARALVVEPKLLILDESLTGLDVDLQAQIVTLLRGLQSGLGIAYILISHDLALAATLAHEIAVLDRGSLIEQAPPAALLAAPRHPVTRELVSASKALAV
jgi:ABC-type dipeptide/oligopeptide/nickel transport system ATPase subunit